MRALLGTSFHVDCERDIERIANDEQLYPTFGDIKLNPSWRHSLSSVERVTLDGFLTFTVSHLSASVLSDSTQDVGSGVVESKDVEGRLKVPSTYETPWQEHK